MVRKTLILIFLFITSLVSWAQEVIDPFDGGAIDRWDNWLIMGNKIVFGGQDDYKHSHEIQWRADENISQLNTLFYEGVLTYSPSQKWEIVPDFRISRRPNRWEFRPGLGVVRKDFFGKDKDHLWAIAQQVKWQGDFKTEGFGTTQAIRYVPSISYVISKKYVVGGLAAALFQWGDGEDITLRFIRAGGSFGIVFDEVHTLNITPAFGAEYLNKDDGWVYSFTPIIQLILRVNKDYKYIPARYINF